MSETHAARRERLRARLAEVDADAALVTRLVNVRYLTGFTGSNAALLVFADSDDSGDPPVLATDGRYDAQAASQVPDLPRVILRNCAEALTERAVGAAGVRRLAFEAHDVTVEAHAVLTAAAAGAELVPLGRAVEALRVAKDDEELALIREACAIGTRALSELIETVVVGRTERSIARELESRMLSHGADAPAFETIVAGGPNSAIPHHRPTFRPLERGDFLKIDFGARFRGYHADATRTFVVGAEPADWQVEVYDLVFAAQRAGRELLAPGVAVRDVDAAARGRIVAAGYGEQFPHQLGHGVGLEIHEAPGIGPLGAGTLAAGMAVTVEPGVYLPGHGGVRIEDTLVVTADAPELLTLTSKELLVL